MGKIKVMASVLIFLFLLNISIPVNVMATPDNIPEQSSFAASTLGFTPFDTVQDKTNPVLYMSDSNNKQIVAYNFETRTKKLLSLGATPKNMLINNILSFFIPTSVIKLVGIFLFMKITGRMRLSLYS